jgi:hypothetical protein
MNFRSLVGIQCFWPLSQTSKKHEGLLLVTHATDPTRNEIIYNLCQKKVSCQCEIQMCGERREILSALPMLFVAEFIDNSKSYHDSVNNEEVGSSPNLEDMSFRNISPIRCYGWQGKECGLQDYDGTFVVKGHVMASDLKEVILDDITGEGHIHLTIFYCPRDISTIMTIWKWQLIQTILNDTSLHAFLCSYDKSYVPKVDDEGEIGVKKKNYTFNKRKKKENETKHPIPKMKKILSDKTCRGVKAKSCCSLNCCQHFPCETMILFKQEFWNKSFEN